MTDTDIGQILDKLNRNYDGIDADRMAPADYDAAIARDQNLIRQLVDAKPQTWHGVKLKAAFLRPLVDAGSTTPEAALTHSIIDDIERLAE